MRERVKCPEPPVGYEDILRGKMLDNNRINDIHLKIKESLPLSMLVMEMNDSDVQSAGTPGTAEKQSPSESLQIAKDFN